MTAAGVRAFFISLAAIAVMVLIAFLCGVLPESPFQAFLKAEEVDPTDKNTMIALREIYARKNQLDKAGEYAKKLEAKD